ncbi:DUF6000 family protein [Aeoliella sp. ICT_H6.2]|uniref:DUF6000 family protein n=1 Tax=Aeoliella straminimaris TaxID=2954799 RepID=A0A9X2JFU8_9BACT|nr:DUF6000 family protein [Aeoliella straminimaris]MCO6044081.1 DUF6000 family protein [Aeoliella straminimaris]
MDKAIIQQWVSPFYLNILHGNFASGIVAGDEQVQFNTNVRAALESITPKIASQLIDDGWREAITGSWFAGLKRFVECRDQIGEMLLASKFCYAGQGHAFGMACLADDASIDFLKQYLNTYLRRVDCYYDQSWAMPALMWIDQQRGTSHADEFLAPGGLWDHFTKDKISANDDAWTIERSKTHFWTNMEYCQDHFLS